MDCGKFSFVYSVASKSNFEEALALLQLLKNTSQ